MGLGSRFSFTIKLGLASNGRLAKALPAEAPAYHWSDLEGVHLLVVEDNPVNQELVQEVLRNHGLIVDLACNGAEALELVAKHEYATVLMDCLMPVMDGFIATETIRKNPRFADLPIIAMTANVMAEEKQRCLASGMNDHIGKPIHWDQLLEKLGHWTKPRSLRELGLTPEKRGVAGDFPALAGVDRNLARNGVSGDAGLYCRLLRTLRQQHADTISMIKSAYAAGDYQAAAQQAHALSGALSAIGAAQLSALMKALQEQFIEEPSQVLVEPMMNHAELGFNKLMHEIDGLIVPAGQ
ncbi:response regulator [Methylomonas rapida]|uniref:Response regulator n=1 Tax=Methylomonas rapida TaxID=2963939 RepID=A0ABY7GJ20_9GAMM|nr:response regulator [Methylomonas rapida]WAR44396.1 response regulator [Methylomonas rapida]